MPQIQQKVVKDLGTQEIVFEGLPYAVVGGTWTGSFTFSSDLYTALVHVVPAGRQLKLLHFRIWTQNAGGARFSIVQYNPAAVGQTGTPEAYPVVGNVPPYTAGLNAVRDYPYLEAAGAEVLQGSLEAPVHVFEGSVIFNILGGAFPQVADGDRFGIEWWGVEADQKR